MKIFAAISVFAAACAAFATDFNPSAQRLKFLADNFGTELSKANAVGALCVAVDGKTVLGRDFSPKTKDGKNRKYALGTASQALMSLLLAAMESDRKIGAEWNVSKHFSYFGIGGESSATFDDLLCMRAGISAHSDALIPADADAADVLQISAQIPPAFKPKEAVERSNLSAACAGYAIGYMFDKREKNYKKSFAAASQKYLFQPLKFEDPRFSSFDKPLFPATAYALSIVDCAKWLECETSPKPPIADAKTIARRRLSRDADGKLGQGWTAASQGTANFFVANDAYENCSCLIAVFPRENAAAAFLVVSKDSAKGTKLCASALSELVGMILNPPEKSGTEK